MTTFTADWFTKNIPAWEKHLAKFKGNPTRALELGSFEGRSACWLLENILTHRDSRIECVDKTITIPLQQNLSIFGRRADFIEMDATEFAGTTIDNYDLIYIDAHHIAKDVIMQAGLLWPLLKRGGVMIFDDYGNSAWTVKPAVDFFLEYWGGTKVLEKKWQVIVEKL